MRQAPGTGRSVSRSGPSCAHILWRRFLDATSSRICRKAATALNGMACWMNCKCCCTHIPSMPSWSRVERCRWTASGYGAEANWLRERSDRICRYGQMTRWLAVWHWHIRAGWQRCRLPRKTGCGRRMMPESIWSCGHLWYRTRCNRSWTGWRSTGSRRCWTCCARAGWHGWRCISPAIA